MEKTHFESLYPDTAHFDEIAKALSFIKEGNSCQLIGLPGVGRADILRLLAYNHAVRFKHLGENQKWFHFVLVNFSEVRKRELIDVMKFLFLSLVDSLQERKMNEEHKVISGIFKESVGIADELVLFQGLKRAIDHLAIEKELTIIFLFDRFESYVPMLTDDFFSNLRALRDRAKYRFSVIFSLYKPLEDILDPSILADYYEFVAGHTIYLKLFDKPSLDFQIGYIEKVKEKKLDEKVKDIILEQTVGYARLTKLAVESLLASSPPAGGLESSSGMTTFLLDQKPVYKALDGIWQSLSPAEQKTLIPQTTTSPLDSTSSYLENIGLVKDGKIAIPLFEAFLRQELTNNPMQTESILFDENTNTIRKGEQILSERLTSAEFRLLKYLLQNPERIVDREEVIQIVWQGEKSTAGVTDQALDQLIFRLRKKIEDDPNRPNHLQTIKGRGFKFSS